MTIGSRPYIGTWQMNAQRLVQHTPDALVYINGDLSLPGCQRCHSRIDLQRFITEVSVDAGTDPGATSASFSLAIPAHHRDSFIRDAQFILRAGLEVHIYMRGYFPVKGLYANLAKPATQTPNVKLDGSKMSGGAATNTGAFKARIPAKIATLFDRAGFTGTKRDMAELIYVRFRDAGFTPAMALAAINQAMFESNLAPGAINKGQYKVEKGVAYGLFQLNRLNGIGKGIPSFMDGKTAGSTALAQSQPDVYYDATDPEINVQRVLRATPAIGKSKGATAAQCFEKFYYSGAAAGRGGQNEEARSKMGEARFGAAWNDKTLNAKAIAQEPRGKPTPPVPDTADPTTNDPYFSDPETVLDTMGLSGYDIENVIAYPYYHVFHGIVTQVTHSYQGGTQTASVQCASMLHFWQYQQMSTNASVFGARPPNSGNKISMVGNNFTGKHPYEIIYMLHHDTAGAAAGVSWAISQKTNQRAKSSLTDESFFSLSKKYWERRFSLRDIKLRMHGVTGEMFNALQAAFLSSLSSRTLMSLIRGRFNNAGKGSKAGDILSQSVAVGLVNKRKLEALLQARNRRGPNKNKSTPSLEINMAEMVAFVSDIAQWGQVQLFESTYESKLDVANKVCEVTGFEFYQDVDGDFVFKPPMYNLDTSGSRVYRIEDIDIISINFEDKEPQVTYMVCKGSHWQNIKVGIDNEFGVQGQYIDYRLVAQYGWRPGNFESSYFTDPKSMFFAAVNRLDIMNAPTRSASVTIPLRPEIRPGYPVYIPYLDAYYYCNSFAHAFSVGGQCSTSLQLIAKRPKFFAPGYPSQRGIEAIDLGNTILPEKPLEVLDNEGRPRLSGFPNVVMALDPSQIDPLFFVVGTDVEKLEEPLTLEFLMKKAMELGVVDAYPDPSRPGPYYVIRTGNEGEGVWFKFASPGSVDMGAIEGAPWKDKQKQPFDLLATAKTLAARRKAIGTKLAKPLKKLQRLQVKAAANDQAAIQAERYNDGTPQKEKAAIKANAQASKSEAAAVKYADQVKAQEAAYQKALSPDDKSALSAFQKLLADVSEAFQRPTTFQSKYAGDPNSSITLLEMLADKKAVFSTKSLPGTYRYYSASHPDAAQQGQDFVTINLTKDADVQSKRVVTTPSFLDPLWSQTPCSTFVKTPPTTPEGFKPEAALTDQVPKRGFLVYTNNPKFPAGEVLPTSEIRELMFASHQVFKESTRGSNSRTNVALITGTEYVDAWEKKATDKGSPVSVGYPEPSNTLAQAMTPWVGFMTTALANAVKAVRGRFSKDIADKIPDFPSVTIPNTVVYKGATISASVALNTYRFQDTTGTAGAWPGAETTEIKYAWYHLAKAYVQAYYDSFVTVETTWRNMVAEQGLDADAMVSLFNNALAGGTNVPKMTNKPRITDKQVRRVKRKKGKRGNGSVLVATPVFPVSDSRGYHVVGSYRYGRDVTIEPNGVFDVLHRQDILSMLDKNLVDNILKTFIQGKAIWAEKPVVGADGKKIVRKTLVKGTEARNYVQEQVLRALRRTYSDQDLIDLGLATMSSTGDGQTMLTFNLMNWIANNKDGVAKLPVVNAAYSLADLAPHTSRDFCSCKAAEASTLLDIAGTREFVSFTQAGKKNYDQVSGEATVDRTVQWMQETTAVVGITWEQSQAALRGSEPNAKPTSLISAVSGLSGQFGEASRRIAAQKAALLGTKDED